jgi:hypothetical protein
MKINVTLAFICLFLGCTQSTSPNSKSVTIDKIYWVFQNTPPDYGDSASMSLDVTVKYSGANLSLADIDYAVFSVGDQMTWNLLFNNNNLNDSAKEIAYGWQSFWTKRLSTNGSVMPIGTYLFTIKLKSGNLAQKPFDMPAPGRTTSGGYSYIYTENYTDQLQPSFFPMLKRPTIGTSIRNGDTIIATFTIDDTLVYSGWVWLFDSMNNYIGLTNEFRNFTTKSRSNIINEGGDIVNNGGVNTVKILSMNCRMKNGGTFNGIKSIRIICTDGRQYSSDSTSHYDCRSIGLMTSIN